MIAESAETADTILFRLVGLLGRDDLPVGRGLVITQARSIHMFFMRFAIDVIFADKRHVVVGLVENIRPFRMSPYYWRASYCIELPSGTIAATRTQKGDTLKMEG